MPNRNNVTTESFRNIFIGFKSTHKHFLIFSNWVQDPDVKLVGDKTLDGPGRRYLLRTRKLQPYDY